MENFGKYILSRLDSVTSIIGMLGLVMLFIGWTSGLFVLFIILIAVPEGHVTEWAKKAGNKVKEFDKELKQ